MIIIIIKGLKIKIMIIYLWIMYLINIKKGLKTKNLKICAYMNILKFITPLELIKKQNYLQKEENNL